MTLLGGAFLVVSLGVVADVGASGPVLDPGVRTGQAATGGPIAGLTADEIQFFGAAAETFAEVDSVEGNIPNETGSGLGPRFNLNSCAGCHAQPASGGSSPRTNPQLTVAHDSVACVPSANACNPAQLSFLKAEGPIREVRFVRNPDGSPDGGVHDLFTITGRSDAKGCTMAQPDFGAAAAQNNLVFRIPTPLFGGGLIEAIPDKAILANKDANRSIKQALGISGQENREANAGTISRFGWKAQNKSLLLFAGEAYNVEMGVTNELFPQKRDETTGCVYNGVPEDHTSTTASSVTDVPSDIQKFALFMRLLAPPAPAAPANHQEQLAIQVGKAAFQQTGCGLCHTPTMKTAAASTAALSNKDVNLYSDLLVHHMGNGLADGIVQGAAQGDQFRTAPLWGLGQRYYFLHDGRTSDVLQAIRAHASPGSEANGVIANFYRLSDPEKQDLLVFLRSL